MFVVLEACLRLQAALVRRYGRIIAGVFNDSLKQAA